MPGLGSSECRPLRSAKNDIRNITATIGAWIMNTSLKSREAYGSASEIISAGIRK
jgi:hypothetical protein